MCHDSATKLRLVNIFKSALTFYSKKISTPFVKQGNTQLEAILKLMPIIVHASEATLRNYLHDIEEMLPKDYGESISTRQ